MDKVQYWKNRKAGKRGQGEKARTHQPGYKINYGDTVDLGIKEFKRKHGDEPKRVLYYKQEMHKAFHELKG